MGAYFGIRNNTRGQAISSYWKGSPPDPAEIRMIAEKMGWDLKKDVIYSGSYCGYYEWDRENGEWYDGSGIPESEFREVDTYEIFDPEGKRTDETTFHFN